MNVCTHVATEDQRAAVGRVGGLLDRAAGAEDVSSRRCRRTQPSEDLNDGTEVRRE